MASRTTFESITEDQLRSLKEQSLKKRDLKIAALAHMAIHGERYPTKSPEWEILSPGERILMRQMTQKDATVKCVEAINYNEMG